MKDSGTSKTSATSSACGRKVKGVDSVRQLSKGDGEIKLEIASGTDDDLRAEIFRAAVETGLILVGFESKTQNLEQVFQNLTTNAPEPERDEEEDEEDYEDDEDLDDEDDASASDDESEEE